MTIIAYPYAKINLGLHVVEKRPDGFHNIETVFYPTSLCDIMEIAPAQGTEPGLQLVTSGIPIPGHPTSNLCCKAYQLLAADYALQPVQLCLHKQIPMGGGLGGGSSDAACCLQLLDKYFGLGLSIEALRGYAARLGSDVAFFVQEQGLQPCLATGRGEVLEPIALDLGAYRLELRFPPVAVSTAEAYAGIKPHRPKVPLREVLARPVSEWKDILVNDFEATVFAKFPIIERYKQDLYNEGALYASMTGSGSTVFGLFGC